MSDPHHADADEPLAEMATPALYNVVYCSRASEGVDDIAVSRIVASARRRNAEQDITGLLVFGSDIFFQWLEGPRDNVTRLMTLLEADPRHRDMVTLSQGEEVRERLFPDWGMELVEADHIRDVLLDALGSAEDAQNTAALQRLLEQLDSGALSDLGGH